MSKTKKEIRKEQIMKSTIILMQKVGYQETSVRAICEAAEISIGSFYHYFKDKSELLDLILGQIDLYLTEKIEPLLTDKSDRINLTNFALGFARETASSSLSYGGVLSSPHIPLPSCDADIEYEQERSLYQIPKRIIVHGQETGEFAINCSADLLTSHLITCLRGYSMDWARRNYSYDIEEYISSFIEIFCKALTP